MGLLSVDISIGGYGVPLISPFSINAARNLFASTITLARSVAMT